MSKEFFSGAYGFVIQPDKETQDLAENLARKIAPNAEFQTTSPHITLYHAKFEGLPKDFIREKLGRLMTYQDMTLTLGVLQVYGDRFIFWNALDKNRLRSAHEIALETAKFLDPKETAKATEEGLKLTEEEQANIKRFGHPLVLTHYLPHITLAYDSKGLRLPPGATHENHVMKVGKILFAEMGDFGSVKTIIDFD